MSAIPSTTGPKYLIGRIYWAFHPIFAFCWFWPTKLRKKSCLSCLENGGHHKENNAKLPKTKKELTKICNEPGIHLQFCIFYGICSGLPPKILYKYDCQSTTLLMLPVISMMVGHMIFWKFERNLVYV